MNEKKTLDIPAEKQFSDRLESLLNQFCNWSKDNLKAEQEPKKSEGWNSLPEGVVAVAKNEASKIACKVVGDKIVSATKRLRGVMTFSIPCDVTSQPFSKVVENLWQTNPSIAELEKAGYAVIFLPSSPNSEATSSMLPMS